MIRLELLKDGVAWTGINSVTLRFATPYGHTVVFERACVSEGGGFWHYTTTVTDFPDETYIGTWRVGVRVLDPDIDDTYDYEAALEVVRQP